MSRLSRRSARLEERMASYSRHARSVVAASPLSVPTDPIAAVSPTVGAALGGVAALGAVLIGAAPAEAQTMTGTTNIVLANGGPYPYTCASFDFDENAVIDAAVCQGTLSTSLGAARPFIVVFSANGVVGYNGAYYPYASALPTGTMVSASRPFLTDSFAVLGSVYGTLGAYGPWVGGVDGFVGLRLDLTLPGEPDAVVVRGASPGGRNVHKAGRRDKTVNREERANSPLEIQKAQAAVHYGFLSLEVAEGATAVTVKGFGYNATAGLPVETGITLPVELTSFHATSRGHTISLEWETASETNNAGFEVQARMVGTTGAFRAIGFVEGAGTSQSALRYRFEADGLVPGVYQFRLKQVDFDGTFEFSAVVEAAAEVPGTHYLGEAYPNPFNPSTTVELAVASEQRVRLDVFNAQGVRVATLHDGVLQAAQTHRFRFQAGDLPAGVYLYRAEGATFVDTGKVTLLK